VRSRPPHACGSQEFGHLFWRICPVINTEQTGAFLAQVSAVHPEDFIVMVVDGASSHVAQALVVPENIRLHRLPGYSPELNPQGRSRPWSGALWWALPTSR
jgi:hypothetical protein